MSKTLVAYFSASGTTAKVAKNLAEAAGAVITEGKLLNGNPSTAELKAWVNTL